PATGRRHPRQRAPRRRGLLARAAHGGPRPGRGPARPLAGRGADGGRRVTTALFVVPPLTGHVNPTISVGAALTARGHEVVWAGQVSPGSSVGAALAARGRGGVWAGRPGVVDRLLPPGARFEPVVGSFGEAELARVQATSRGLRGPEALKFLWEDFIVPYARA